MLEGLRDSNNKSIDLLKFFSLFLLFFEWGLMKVTRIKNRTENAATVCLVLTYNQLLCSQTVCHHVKQFSLFVFTVRDGGSLSMQLRNQIQLSNGKFFHSGYRLSLYDLVATRSPFSLNVADDLHVPESSIAQNLFLVARLLSKIIDALSTIDFRQACHQRSLVDRSTRNR